MYQPQQDARIPNTIYQRQAPPRRNPLSSAGNHVNHPQTPPKAPPKPPPSPPLPRQSVKVTPPSPPKIIIDKTGRYQFNRVGFLGEVGFLVYR